MQRKSKLVPLDESPVSSSKDFGLYSFLAGVRVRLVRLCGEGRGSRVERAVTFQDLVDLGLTDEKTATKQAGKI